MDQLACKWIVRHLYKPCIICQGKGRIRPGSVRGATTTPDDDGRVTCPACDGRGLVDTGINVGDVEGIRDRVHALTARAEKAEAELKRLQLERRHTPWDEWFGSAGRRGRST
jgi:hypothetical protein